MRRRCWLSPRHATEARSPFGPQGIAAARAATHCCHDIGCTARSEWPKRSADRAAGSSTGAIASGRPHPCPACASTSGTAADTNLADSTTIIDGSWYRASGRGYTRLACSPAAHRRRSLPDAAIVQRNCQASCPAVLYRSCGEARRSTVTCCCEQRTRRMGVGLLTCVALTPFPHQGLRVACPEGSLHDLVGRRGSHSAALNSLRCMT